MFSTLSKSFCSKLSYSEFHLARFEESSLKTLNPISRFGTDSPESGVSFPFFSSLDKISSPLLLIRSLPISQIF